MENRLLFDYQTDNLIIAEIFSGDFKGIAATFNPLEKSISKIDLGVLGLEDICGKALKN